MSAPKTVDWKDLTPKSLLAPIEHLRSQFDHFAWKCSRITEKLCFTDLHPSEIEEDLEDYRASFVLYRQVIGQPASAEFDRIRRQDTPSAIFHAYSEAYRAGLESRVEGLFADILQIGIANEASLDRNPVDWAKAQLHLMIAQTQRHAVTWIKNVCDKQPLTTKVPVTNEDLDEFIWWRTWRAPKLVHMRPSGNTLYNAATAWTREDEPTTLKLLDGLSGRFTEFIGFHLDSIAGKAHVHLAKQSPAGKIRRSAELHVPSEDDWKFARLALEEARKSVPESDGRPHPLVGAVVVKDGEVLAFAHRGEAIGNHAEYIALEKRLGDAAVAGATVYTTLEPCTTRNHPKVPCADRLIERRVRRVVIGMLDPNPEICGRGQRRLRGANIMTDFFPSDLMAQVEEINREFSRSIQLESKARQAVPPRQLQPAISADTVIGRIRRARSAVGLSARPTLAVASWPSQATEFPRLFESPNADVVRLLENPPRLRNGGFDLNTKRPSEIIHGELRRTSAGDKLLELWRDGLLIFIGPGDEWHLSWGSPTEKEVGLRINNLALAETTFLFADLALRVYKHAAPQPERLNVWLLLFDMTRNGKLCSLNPHPVDSSGSWARLDRREAPWESKDFYIEVALAGCDPGVVSYSVLRQLYAWFGFDEVQMPYVIRNAESRIDLSHLKQN